MSCDRSAELTASEAQLNPRPLLKPERQKKSPMEIGFIGLGKMGLNMVTRLQRAGHRVVGYDRSDEAVNQAVAVGCERSASIADLSQKLAPPRAVWIMVPSGAPTEATVQAVSDFLEPGDIVIDGGNTRFHDDVRRAKDLALRGLHYLDVGTSGGIWGLEAGYCLMVGGDEKPVKQLAPIFESLAPPNGWAHLGAVGAGHYVKMVHNGIEYSMMQGYAEGFELMSKSDYRLDLARVADLWMQGSVVRSWLLELAAGALKKDPSLEGLKGFVQDSGEGRWMIADAIENDVPVPTLTAALFTRFRSRQTDSFAEKMLAALRNAFGGHDVRR